MLINELKTNSNKKSSIPQDRLDKLAGAIVAAASAVSGKAGAQVGASVPPTTGRATAGVGVAVTNTKAATVPTTVSGGVGSSAALNDTQRAEAALVARLPADFPFAQWDSMPTKAQFLTMQNSGLNAQEQWQLHNTSTPLEILALANTAQSRAKSGTLTDREANDLIDRSLRYATSRSQLVSGNASSLPPLQKGLLRRELEEEIGTLRAKAEEGRESGNDDPPTIYDYPAIEQMLDGQEASKAQKIMLAEAQKTLGLLHNMKNSSQQQVDDVIAKVCTELLNDSNAPKMKGADERQTAIPAYTNAIDGLLGRLRTLGESKGKLLAKQGQKGLLYNGQPSLGNPQIWVNICDLFFKSLERGNLNLRERDIWENMITQYDETAPSLSGSQYMFVYNGQLLRVEDAGNAIYGYYGSALGLTPSDLYQGAGIAASFKKSFDSGSGTVPNIQNGFVADDFEDRAAIAQGISWYMEGK